MNKIKLLPATLALFLPFMTTLVVHGAELSVVDIESANERFISNHIDSLKPLVDSPTTKVSISHSELNGNVMSTTGYIEFKNNVRCQEVVESEDIEGFELYTVHRYTCSRNGRVFLSSDKRIRGY